MNTLELIKDAALLGGNVPNERIDEVRGFLDKIEKQLNLPDANNTDGEYCECGIKDPEIKAMWVVCRTCNRVIIDE